MGEKYYKYCNGNHQYYRNGNITYSSCIKYVRENGIKVNFNINRFNITRAYVQNTDVPNQITQFADEEKQAEEGDGLFGRGLLYYRKWWENNETDIFVNGDKLTGIPIFFEQNTLRVINDCYSYFIPLEKVEYIRTAEGLKSCSGIKYNNNTKSNL